MIRIHTCKLYPDDDQLAELEYWLHVTHKFYNYCLGQRIKAWKSDKTRISEYDQNNEVSQLRRVMPSFQMVPSRVLYDVARRMDQAFKAFFRRLKAGATPGFPHFQSWRDWKCFRFSIESKFVFGSFLKFPKMTKMKTRGLNRKIEGELLFCCVVREPDGWYCHITSDDGLEKPAKLPIQSSVGIDVGLNKHECPSCGLVLDRDHNSARNILDRATRPLSGMRKDSGGGKARRRKSNLKQAEHINAR